MSEYEDNARSIFHKVAEETVARLEQTFLLPNFTWYADEERFPRDVPAISVVAPPTSRVTKGSVMHESQRLPGIRKDVAYNKSAQYEFPWDGHLKSLQDVAVLNDDYLREGAVKIASQYNSGGFDLLLPNLYLMDGGDGKSITFDDLIKIDIHVAYMLNDSYEIHGILHPYDLERIKEKIVKTKNEPHKRLPRGMKGVYSRLQLYESNDIPHLRVAAIGRSQPRIAKSQQSGNTIKTNGWELSEVSYCVLNKGQLIKIEGVREIQPRENGKITGNLMSFVVTENVNLPANYDGRPIEISIDPEIVVKDQMVDISPEVESKKFLYRNVESGPEEGAEVEVVGAGVDGRGGTYRQAVFFKKGCFVYIHKLAEHIPMYVPWQGVAKASQTKLSVEATGRYNNHSTSGIVLLKGIYGFAVLRPDFGIRFIGERIGD